jgi:hypothetical protein
MDGRWLVIGIVGGSVGLVVFFQLLNMVIN